MTEKVYVDILLFTNFIIDYILLMITERLCGKRMNKKRIVLSATIGSLSALTIFLPYLGLPTEIALKVAISVVMLLVAFGYSTFKRFLWEFFIFFTVNFLTAGVMLAVTVTFSPKNMLYYNGVVYFDISAVILIINIALVYLIISLIDLFLRRTSAENGKYDVQLYFMGKSCKLKAIMDTGNRLREPFSGTPVVVVCLKDILNILPEQLADYISSCGWEDITLDNDLPADIKKRFRVIPCSHVGGAGLMASIRGDKIIAKNEKNPTHTIICEDFYIGVNIEKVGDGEYNMLLHSALNVRKTSEQLPENIMA